MKTNGERFLQALGRLVWRNKRRYGAYGAHAGIILCVVGIAGSSAYQREYTWERQSPGSSMDFEGYRLVYDRHRLESLPEHQALVLETRLERSGRELARLVAQKRVYANVETPTTEV